MRALLAGGVFLGICGREPPGSPNPDPISDQKIVISHTRFQTWPLKSRHIFGPGVGRNYVIISWFRMPTKIFLKIHFEFAYYSFFLIYLELKRQTRSCTPVENHTRIQTKTGKVYTPVSDQNGAKTIPFKAAYTYKENVRENPSPPGGGTVDSGKGVKARRSWLGWESDPLSRDNFSSYTVNQSTLSDIEQHEVAETSLSRWINQSFQTIMNVSHGWYSILVLGWFSNRKGTSVDNGKRVRKGLNATSGAQFAALPFGQLVKPVAEPVVWFAHAIVNWRYGSVAI